jgi:hypothetical protein
MTCSITICAIVRNYIIAAAILAHFHARLS